MSASVVSTQPVNARMVSIECTHSTHEVPLGTPVGTVLEHATHPDGLPFLGAVLNHRLVDWDEPIWGVGHCRGITIEDGWMGASIYRRSATLILYEAARELFPRLQLEIGQSIGNGYHFLLHGEIPAEADWIVQLEQRCQEIIRQKRVFYRRVANIEEAITLFREQGSEDKVQLLEVWSTDLVHLVSLGAFYDIQHGPVVPTTGHINPFHLEPLEPGFVLEFEDAVRIGIGLDASKQTTLFKAYQESRQWNRIIGVTNVGQLNGLALKSKTRDIIRITEGFHEKKVAQIADQIAGREGIRLVTIAGPSSAGKTTFAKRLGVQMRVNGLDPVSISLDDYYLDWESMPRLPDGRWDFESIEALDLPLFNEHLRDLLAGEEIHVPHFDFVRGRRKPASESTAMRLDPHQILVIEGIHGLNPRLSESIPEGFKFKIFINALTQLNLDQSNRLFTSETRLLRRIVRDRRYRGYSAAHTIQQWSEVRAGERKYIFPFQEGADAMFNSALIYEPSVLKLFAERYLLEVPREHPSAPFAHRLRNFLQLFVPIEPYNIPPTSILREFIGDALKY